MSLKAKYLKGWINSESMDNSGWVQVWKQSAQDAEKERCSLVVFKIPNHKHVSVSDSETVAQIEQLLQEKFGE